MTQIPLAILHSPLYITLPRKRVADKKFILNLNNYRNTHFQVLNQAKVFYKEEMARQVELLPPLGVIAVRYTLFPKTERRTDTHNVCCIHEKFFMDCLVEMGKLEDDDYFHYTETHYVFGSVEKDNPRVDIEIYQRM